MNPTKKVLFRFDGIIAQTINISIQINESLHPYGKLVENYSIWLQDLTDYFSPTVLELANFFSI